MYILHLNVVVLIVYEKYKYFTDNVVCEYLINKIWNNYKNF